MDFDQSDAFVGDIDYTSGRKLNRDLIQLLVTDDTSLIRLTLKKIEEVKDSKKEESKTTGIRPEFNEAKKIERAGSRKNGYWRVINTD